MAESGLQTIKTISPLRCRDLPADVASTCGLRMNSGEAPPQDTKASGWLFCTALICAGMSNLEDTLDTT